jgi:DNA modification methylase
MKTGHHIIFRNSNRMSDIDSESVGLVVTSPPYPMIEMWDEIFIRQNPKIGDFLSRGQGSKAYELMHKVLDDVWDEVFRILTPGGIACINIGDATRTLALDFKLYTNHARIMTYMQGIGFSSLPMIIWRKQTNAPNKFMGSGMLAPGAYVTLEHEFILIFRKGPKREFITPVKKSLRRESAFFWEERNTWFSDVWFDLKGTTQRLNNNKMRLRSGAFPFELPYRLINMFSIKGDLVVDPFMGMATTMFAAMAAGRNSIGYEIDANFKELILSKIQMIVISSNQRIRERLSRHLDFIRARAETKGMFKYLNSRYGFPVLTRQEKDLLLNQIESVKRVGDRSFEAVYSDEPQPEFMRQCENLIISEKSIKDSKRAVKRVYDPKNTIELFK